MHICGIDTNSCLYNSVTTHQNGLYMCRTPPEIHAALIPTHIYIITQFNNRQINQSRKALPNQTGHSVFQTELNTQSSEPNRAPNLPNQTEHPIFRTEHPVFRTERLYTLRSSGVPRIALSGSGKAPICLLHTPLSLSSQLPVSSGLGKSPSRTLTSTMCPSGQSNFSPQYPPQTALASS